MADARVYVIDEDPLVVENLRAALVQEPGYIVNIFRGLRDIQDAASARPPDAVVCGLRLPGGSGLDLVESLRQADPDVVALVMTRTTDAGGPAEVLAALGPLQQVYKPADFSDLLPKLRAGLERRELAIALRETRAALENRDEALQATAQAVADANAELELTHTELATATERLVQAEQLAAVGRVVTGIAHELGRQLALVGYAEAIKSRVADDPELVEFADIIVNAQKRLAAMVDEMRDFVAAEGEPRGALDREPADVVAVVDEALAILRYDRDVRERVIERDYRGRPLAALDRNKFCQVVINLVSNAVLATQPGDAIAVRVAIDRMNRAGQFAIITVADRGAGMRPEVLARLGEPFFTTRGDRGSGLGVGICMRIVEEHGGQLTFASEVGRGTTARVTMPILPDMAPGVTP